MKILIFNWRDISHPLSGGAEASLVEHAKYWEKKGADIIWFSTNFPGAISEENIDGIKFIRKGSYYTSFIWGFIYYITGKFGKIDVVIDCFHFIPFFTPLYFSRHRIIGLINEVAGKVWFDNLPFIFALIGYYTEPIFFKFYKKVIFISSSESTKKELINIGIDPKNIKIVFHGIRIAKVYNAITKEINPTLVFLGRVSKDKGISEVINAYIKSKIVVKNLKLWIIGKEEKPGMLQALLKDIEEKIKKDITYFGFVSEEKKVELLRKAWLLIHPSKKEGWGLNVIEAASQGTPTVGNDVEGLRDSIKNGITGILVDPKEPSLLADAILSIIMDKSKKQYLYLSNNAKEWSKNFNWEVSTKESWNIVRNIYNEKKS